MWTRTFFIRKVLFYKSLYPNIHPTFEWDGDKLIRGPVLGKCDSGPGRNCKSERSIQFRHDMHKLGFHLWPGLPNGTGVNQEMDDLFQNYKGDTDAKCEEIFRRKTFEQALAVEQMKKDQEIQIPVAHLTNNDIPEIVDGRPEDPIEK